MCFKAGALNKDTDLLIPDYGQQMNWIDEQSQSQENQTRFNCLE